MGLLINLAKYIVVRKINNESQEENTQEACVCEPPLSGV